MKYTTRLKIKTEDSFADIAGPIFEANNPQDAFDQIFTTFNPNVTKITLVECLPLAYQWNAQTITIMREEWENHSKPKEPDVRADQEGKRDSIKIENGWVRLKNYHFKDGNWSMSETSFLFQNVQEMHSNEAGPHAGCTWIRTDDSHFRANIPFEIVFKLFSEYSMHAVFIPFNKRSI